MSFEEPDRRLRGLMEAVAARVWIADLRPSLAIAQGLADGGDVAAAVRAHPERAVDLYAAMVPLAWNTGAAATYGLPDRHPADALVNVPTENLGQLTDTVAVVLGGAPHGVVEFRADSADGGVVATRFAWSVVGPEDDPLSQVVFASLDRADIISEQALRRERRQQLRAALRGSNTAVFKFGTDLRVVWVENARTREDFDFTGLDPGECFGPDAGRVITDLFRRIVDEGVEGSAEVALTRDGETRYFDFRARPWRNATGLITGIVGTNTDVTERARLLRELAAAAVTDGLTGLLNRQGLAAALDALAVDGASTGALVAFDIPGFQGINDTYGHEAGDACLVSVARVLREQVHVGDLVSRFGGDQFAVLLKSGGGASVQAAEDEAVRLRTAIEAMAVPVGDRLEIHLPVVAGIASAEGLLSGRRSASDLLGDVDIALGRAKRRRATVSVIEADAEAHRQTVRRRLEWGTLVRDAVYADALQVHAQPIVDLASGTPRAYELLVRLRADGEVVPAGVFMPDIQMLGMVPMVDRWVVRHAVQLVATHAADLAGRRLAVNVSATMLTEGGLIDLLDSVAQSTGADLSLLAIEMTETEAVADRGAAREVIAALHERGALFVLDDFGTGHAAPEYLADLDVDWLKIDGAFVARANDSRVDRAIITGALAVAEAMGIPVVAEWIEDERTRDLMQGMGVTLGQGFLLGRPDEVATVVAAA